MMHIELFSLVAANMLANLCYSVGIPFIPIKLKSLKVDEAYYGYIFAIYAMAVLIGSPVVGKALSKYGRKCILIIGVFGMGVSLSAFSLIGYLPFDGVLPVGLILRALQGLSSGIIQTSSYAIISVIYPQNQSKFLGYLEASMGFGLGVGPAVGSIAYSFLKFEGTFLSIGMVMFLSVIAMAAIIPQTVDKTDRSANKKSDKLEEGGETSTQIDFEIRYVDILGQKVFIGSGFAAFCAYFVFTYCEPVLAIRLMEFELSEFWIGVFFGLNAIGYIIGSLTVPYFTDFSNNRMSIVVGLIITGLAQFLIGPSLLFPNELWIMALGQLIFGVFTLYFQIPSLPEMISDVVQTHPNQKFEASDISSGVYNSMLGLGQMVSPLYGSYFTHFFGFRMGADSVGLLLVLYGIWYFVAGGARVDKHGGYEEIEGSVKS